MAEYATGIPKHNTIGKKTLKVVIASGAVQMQIQLDGEGFSNVTDGSFSESTTKTVSLPDCDIQFIMTGTASVYMKTTK